MRSQIFHPRIITLNLCYSNFRRYFRIDNIYPSWNSVVYLSFRLNAVCICSYWHMAGVRLFASCILYSWTPYKFHTLTSNSASHTRPNGAKPNIKHILDFYIVCMHSDMRDSRANQETNKLNAHSQQLLHTRTGWLVTMRIPLALVDELDGTGR